ncbi:hypothetical protein L1887_15509 [Cichorium endivia]|nr:hypothetical protein L1887_15509 [Cichorium endivia]
MERTTHNPNNETTKSMPMTHSSFDATTIAVESAVGGAATADDSGGRCKTTPVICGGGVAVIGAAGGSRKSQDKRRGVEINEEKRGRKREPDLVEADFPTIKTSRGWKNKPCMWSVKFADDFALMREKGLRLQTARLPISDGVFACVAQCMLHKCPAVEDE